MRRFYFYLLALSLSVQPIMAQENNKDVTKFHGYEQSQKMGVLSKFAKMGKAETPQQKMPLHSSFLTAKYGIRANAGTAERLQESNYEFHGLLHTGISMPLDYANDASGNLYITGTTADNQSAKGTFVTIKINSSGTKVWEKRKTGTLYAGELGFAITLDGSGNPIATGIHWNGNDMDVHVIKYDAANGNIIWERTFAGNANGLDVPTAITTDINGNIIVAGMTYTGTSVRFLTLKYNGNGTLLWSATDDNEVENAWNEPSAITTDSAGNIAVTGYAANADYWQTYYTIKYDTNGTVAWKKSYTFQDISDPEDPESPLTDVNAAASGVDFDSNGNCYVTGTFNTAWGRAGTIKYNINGEQQWVREYQAPNDHTQGYDIKTTGSTVYVSGRHLGSWADDGVFLVSYSSAGTLNWAKENNNLIDTRGAHMKLGTDNLPVVAGWGYDPDTSDNRIRVIKYAANGDVLQEASYLKPATPTTSLMDFIGFGMDSGNNIYAALNSGFSELGTTFESVKLTFGATEPVWSSVYNGASLSNLSMLAAVNDSNNNTYMTGMSGSVIGEEYVTSYVVTKYNGSGNVDWEKQFNPGNGNGSNGIQIITTADDALIVYLIPEGFGSQPLKLKKYDAAGNLVWEFTKTVYSPDLYAMYTDDSGNIYLSGGAMENETDEGRTFATIKISSTGTELWSTYTPSGNAEDNIYALNSGKVTPEGDVIVAGAVGQGSFFSSETDIAVLKYAANGTLQWFHTVDITDNNSAAQDLLIDATGNIFINGVAQDINTFRETIALVKLDASATPIWIGTHEESGRDSRSYTLRQLSTGETVVTGFSVIYGVNNKVIAVKFDTDGNEAWTKDTATEHFYRDVHVDAADNIYILNQIYASPFPQRLYYSSGPFYIGQMVRIDASGTESEEFFAGPELSAFNPVNLIAQPDGRLLVPGSLENELNFFQGYYFFESEHALGNDEHGNPETNHNWLGQNYPNPANGLTQIPFYSETGGKASIKLYDITGKYIRAIAEGNFDQGHNTVAVDVSGIQSGLYFYQITCGNFKQSRKLVIN